jgi:rhamnulokinase
MSQATDFLAIDLGASSGRVMLGRWDGRRFDLRELHRFPNGPVSVMGRQHWDVLRLWQEVKEGIARYARQHDAPPAGIGIDTWAVDFALLDEAGEMLGNPYHYRDRRTEGIPEYVDGRVSPQHLYGRTGIQRLPINTLYQLVSMRRVDDPRLDAAKTFLLVPDLFHYWMTGRIVAEYTNATTTQFYDPSAQGWASDLLEELQLPARILPPVVAPGTILGELLPDVRKEVALRGSPPVISCATHDTASAVAAVPNLDERSAFISSGTWNLVGVEVSDPILSEKARDLNFTNEGGVGETIRFLKNVTGFWLLQECQRRWQREGKTYTWPDLVALAEQAAPLQSMVDPDVPEFASPGDMPKAIREYCRHSGQPVPESDGEVVRCCLDSLALKHRWILAALEELTDRRLDTIRIVGGGSQNKLFCQLTADACQRTVVTGPVEATALGNILVQAFASGCLPDITTGRRAVGASEEQVTFEPRDSGDWDAAFAGFDELVQAAGKI